MVPGINVLSRGAPHYMLCAPPPKKVVGTIEVLYTRKAPVIAEKEMERMMTNGAAPDAFLADEISAVLMVSLDFLQASVSGPRRAQAPLESIRFPIAGPAMPDIEQAIVTAMEEISRRWPWYGHRRVGAELARRGLRVNGKKVRRLMRAGGLGPGRWPPPEAGATGPGIDGVQAPAGRPNLLAGLEPDGPDQAWASDITCVRLELETVFLAAVVDLFSRRCIGWALGRAPNGGLVMGAVRMALRERAGKRTASLIHHSDNGLVRLCPCLERFLAEHGIMASVSRRGYPYHNAPVERFIETLKCEQLRIFAAPDYESALGNMEELVIEVYNRRRLNRALGCRPPAEFEELWQSGADGNRPGTVEHAR